MKILIIAFTFLIPHLLYATEQISDKLIYMGRHYEWKGYSPAYDTLKSFKVPDDAVITTGNYNIYIATYTIENDSLFLTDVTILTQNKDGLHEKSVFQKFFPERKRISMTSYSNIRTIPYGNLVEVTKHNWTDTHYTNYLVFEFKGGYVKNAYDFSYSKYLKLKKDLFKKFKRTPEYVKANQNEVQNLQAFNDYRPRKYTMNQYLEHVILRLVKTLSD